MASAGVAGCGLKGWRRLGLALDSDIKRSSPRLASGVWHCVDKDVDVIL